MVVTDESRFVEGSKKRFREWLVVCDCGNQKWVRHSNIHRTASCNQCKYRLKNCADPNHPLYQTWSSMIRRCHDASHHAYDRYGGRGIYVCMEWQEDFTRFVEDMGPRPSDDMTVDRKNNDGPYCPENCRWATRRQQSRNTRANVRVEYQGRDWSLVELCDSLGLSYQTIWYRIRRGGYSVEEAILKPVDQATKIEQYRLHGSVVQAESPDGTRRP